MAKKKTNKIPKNTTKHIDATKYLAENLEQRGVSMAAQRKLYTQFRNTALKRIKRLNEKGITDTPELKKINLPTLKEIDENMYPTHYFHFKLIEAINFINNPLTLISNQNRREEVKIIETLKSHGYDVAAKNIKKFGKFMEAVRARYIGLFYDSDRIARWYERMQSENGKTSIDDMVDSYIAWQEKEDRLLVENMKLLYPDDYKKRLQEMTDKTEKEINDLLKRTR